MLDPVLLLAGGKSTRAGGPKGLKKVRGQFWLEAQLDRLTLAGVKDVILIFGHYSEKYHQELPWTLETLHWHKGDVLRVHCRINSEPEKGQFSSIQTGLRSLSTFISRGAFILPIDVPAAQSETWELIQKEVKPHSQFEVIQPELKKLRGHPVWISKDFATWLLHLDLSDPTARLDWQIKALPEHQKKTVSCSDPHILENFNFSTDYLPQFSSLNSPR